MQEACGLLHERRGGDNPFIAIIEHITEVEDGIRGLPGASALFLALTITLFWPEQALSPSMVTHLSFARILQSLPPQDWRAKLSKHLFKLYFWVQTLAVTKLGGFGGQSDAVGRRNPSKYENSKSMRIIWIGFDCF